MGMRSRGKLSSDPLNLEVPFWQDSPVVGHAVMWLGTLQQITLPAAGPASPPLRGGTRALNTQKGCLTPPFADWPCSMVSVYGPGRDTVTERVTSLAQCSWDRLFLAWCYPGLSHKIACCNCLAVT